MTEWEPKGMRATFHNKLEVVKDFEGRKKIQYHHPFRLEIDFFIEPKMKIKERGERNWEVSLKPRSGKEIAQGVKAQVAGEFVSYLKRRIKSDMKTVTFKKLEILAEVQSIQ